MSEMLGIIFLFLALATLVFIIILIFIHLYQIFEEPAIQSKMRTLRKTKQPWVTVLLYARNSEATVIESLKAVLKSRYYNYDIVVIDDRSEDRTSQLVKDFAAAHSAARITLLKRRVKRSTSEALQAGYRKSKHGEVVVSIKSGAAISNSFLKRAVAIKGEKKQLTLKVGSRISMDSLGEITQLLSAFFWQRSYKVTVSNVKHIALSKNQIKYDFLGAIIFGFIILSSLILQELIIVWYCWLIITGYLCAIIWLQEESIAAKLQLTFSAISAFFVLPVASLVVGFSQLNSRK